MEKDYIYKEPTQEEIWNQKILKDLVEKYQLPFEISGYGTFFIIRVPNRLLVFHGALMYCMGFLEGYAKRFYEERE